MEKRMGKGDSVSRCQDALRESGGGSADDGLNYSVLLQAHLICVDQLIHMNETRHLQGLLGSEPIGARTLGEVEKILCLADDHIPAEECLPRVLAEERLEVLRALTVVAYADGYCDPVERQFLEDTARHWGLPKVTLDRWCAVAEEALLAERSDEPASWGNAGASFAARMLHGFDVVFSPEAVGGLARMASAQEKLEELRREFLLAGPEYDEALGRCARVAEEDFGVTEEALNQVWRTLRSLDLSLAVAINRVRKRASRSQAATAREVVEQLEQTRDALSEQILRETEIVRESLYRKRRATQYFTLAFLGKTKAGKSTLHAVLTGEGWEGIGGGKQRTTRYNRMYEWKGVRIIDTPGIGAPGGENDEEIAKSVIDEADVVCFVLTNNNQQETEFRFLRLLKQKAKPLVIVLNVQENLDNPVRCDRFLSNPDRLFAMDPLRLGGNIDRIRRYASEHYDSACFDIIPVQLLAAKKARFNGEGSSSVALLKASRLQGFLDSVRVSLIRDGTIRRSQTLLGCTVADVERSAVWAGQQSRYHEAFSSDVQHRRDKALAHMTKTGTASGQRLETRIRAVFQGVLLGVQAFAEDHWNCDQETLDVAWKAHLTRAGLEGRLSARARVTYDEYQGAVRDILEELGRDLEMIAHLGAFSFQLEEQDSSFFFKGMLKWGGASLGVVATVLAFVPGGQPFAMALGVAAGIISFISTRFKSKAEKQRQAVAGLGNALRMQLTESCNEYIADQRKRFDQHRTSLEDAVQAYFGPLVSGLRKMGKEMRQAETGLRTVQVSLNLAYACRVVAWAEGQGEKGGDGIVGVRREVGKYMHIRMARPVKVIRKQEELSMVLQEDVEFEVEDSKSNLGKGLKR